MREIASILLGLAVCIPAPAAGEEYDSLKDDSHTAQAETHAHGCYYHRGRRYCARYCYWEVNGKRYCQERRRQAHPQAYYFLEEEYSAPEARYRPRRH